MKTKKSKGKRSRLADIEKLNPKNTINNKQSVRELKGQLAEVRRRVEILTVSRNSFSADLRREVRHSETKQQEIYDILLVIDLLMQRVESHCHSCEYDDDLIFELESALRGRRMNCLSVKFSANLFLV